MAQQIKSKGLLSIAVLGSGNILGTIISAIALILFSRYMGPTEFGLFSAAFAAMQIVVRLTDLGTNTAVERAIARVIASNIRLADRLMRVALWFKLFTYLICVSIAWYLSPWIAHSFLKIDDVALIRSAFLYSLGTIFFEYSRIILQSSHKFALVAHITIAQAIGKLGFGLIFIWQGLLNAGNALFIYGLIPGIGALLAWKRNTLSSFMLPQTWKADFKIIFAVAKWTAVAAIAATLSDNIDTLLVQSFMSSYETGIWAGAVRIATFASVIGWSVGAVLNVRVAKYTDPKNLRNYLNKSWKLSLAIIFLLALSLPFAPIIINLTIGSAYLEGVIPLQILIMSSALSGAASPYIALFYLFDKPQYYAYAGIIETITIILGGIILIPMFGLVGAAVARVLVRAIVLGFTLIYARSAYVSYRPLRTY